jgi:homoserine O-acetyltransferase
MLARMLGHITYLSDDALDEKFGRELRDGEIKFGYEAEFQIESYLRYQGRTFVDRFDANSYLLLTKVLDYFDPAGDTEGSLSKAMAPATAKFMIISFSSDWRFSPERSQEIVSALLEANKCVSYIEIQSTQGHDSFLMPIPRYHQVIKTALDRIAKGLDL